MIWRSSGMAFSLEKLWGAQASDSASRHCKEQQQRNVHRAAAAQQQRSVQQLDSCVGMEMLAVDAAARALCDCLQDSA
jgi:hypothetical protein